MKIMDFISRKRKALKAEQEALEQEWIRESLFEFKQIQEDFQMAFKERFGEKAKNFEIVEESLPPYSMFTFTFEFYDYFILAQNYSRGCIGCNIILGDYGVSVESDQEWYEEIDMDKYLNTIQKDIENRIPKKFLESRGWTSEGKQ